MPSFVNLLWQVPIFLLLIMCIYELVEQQPPNGCEMTYMFKPPEYIKLKMPNRLSSNFTRFDLYLYGEWFQADRYKNALEEIDGIPVLFIPGNAGSYRQVRSLGSVSLHLGVHKNTNLHFDYFSIDFNEALYAYYGGELDLHLDYVHTCIKYILSLYQKPGHIPTSVILVGHSMGGMLARALYTLPDFDKKSVNLIYTQATPHQSPVAYTDYLPEFYRRVNVFWLQEKDLDLNHVTLVSTGDGARDLLVNYHLTTLNELVSPNRHISVSTMSVPRAWSSTDHQCAVWCKQMVKITVKSMYDLVDNRTNQITIDQARRRRILQHHFLYNTGSSKHVLATPKINISFKQEFEWDHLDDMNKLILNKYTSTMDKYFSFTVNSKYDQMIVETSMPGHSWIFGCDVHKFEESCSHGDDLTHRAHILPNSTESRKLLSISSGVLKQYTKIVFHISKTAPRKHIYLHVRFFERRGDLHTVYHAPRPSDLLLDFPRSLYHHNDEVISTISGDTYRLVTLPTLSDIYQAYTAHLHILSCTEDKILHSYMRFHTPWNHGSDQWALVSPSSGSGNLSLKLMVPTPPDLFRPAELHLYLQPMCTYKLTVSIDFRSSMSQIARFYFQYLPSFVTANLFMVLCHQLFKISKGHGCPSVAVAQDTYGQPWKLALGTSILELILSSSIARETLDKSGLSLPPTDGFVLQMKGLYFPLMHLLLYSLAFIIVRVVANATHYTLVVFGKIMRVLFHHIFTHNTIPMIGSLLWWLILVAGIYSSWNYTGSLGMLVTIGLLLADITSSYVTFPSEDRRHSMWMLQHTLLLLTLTAFLLTLPELVTWVKNLSFDSYLKADPSRYPAIVIATPLMLVRFNTAHENWYTSWLYSSSPVVLSLIALLYGTVNIWRLNVIIPAVFVWVASIQSLGILLVRQKSSHQFVAEKIETFHKKASPRKNLLGDKDRNSELKNKGKDNSH